LLLLSVLNPVFYVAGPLDEGLELFVEDEPWPPTLFLERSLLGLAPLALGSHGPSASSGELLDSLGERLEGLGDRALRAGVVLLATTFLGHFIHLLLSVDV
jgi:hypothetical protein